MALSVVFVNKAVGWERVTVQTESFLIKDHELFHFFWAEGKKCLCTCMYVQSQSLNRFSSSINFLHWYRRLLKNICVITVAFFEAQVHCYCPVGFHRWLQSDLYIRRGQSSNQFKPVLTCCTCKCCVCEQSSGLTKSCSANRVMFLNKGHEDLIHFFLLGGRGKKCWGLLCGTSTMFLPCGVSQ